MDIQRPSPSDRFQVREFALAAPGQCGICGSAKRPMVDFGMSFIGYGRFYICDLCMGSAATAIGYVPLAEAEKAVDAAVTDYLAETGQKLVKADYVDNVDRLFADFASIASCYDPSDFHSRAGAEAGDISTESEDAKPRKSAAPKRVDKKPLLGTDEVDFDNLLSEPAGVSSNSFDEFNLE